jgi:predicted  nucleic acid-binding Zn-ribbon protein
MKENIEKKITEKENAIKTMNMEMEDIKKGLKQLTLEEYEIENFIIKQCLRIKELRSNIKTLQYEVYELMRILKY